MGTRLAPRRILPLLFLLLLPFASCGQSGLGARVLLDIAAPDDIEQYDLYIRDDSAHTILLHTGWSDATKMGMRMVSKESLKIGLTFPMMLSPAGYTVVIVGAIGKTDQIHVDWTDPKARQFFWARSFPVGGDGRIEGKLSEVLKADDADLDIFPSGATWGNPEKIDARLLDCNDQMELINPFAREVCGDNIDENCSGNDDEVCVDTDGDGDPDSDDCKPMDPTIHFPTKADPYPEIANCCGYSLGKMGPDANKNFDGDPMCHKGSCGDMIDQDCDTLDLKCVVDADCDGFPTPADCDDNDPAINPAAPEICDMKDNNCNKFTDEVCVKCDLDGDGYERMGAGCPDNKDPHPGMVDCDDEDAGVFPGSTATPSKLPRLGNQTCMGMEGGNAVCALRATCRNKKPDGSNQDANCNAMAYEGCPPALMDKDGDGFAAGPGDCNDNDPHVFAGAPEICGDSVAQGCAQDVACMNDKDGDKYNADDDCDDNDPNVHPWATELCNGKDDDCDGLTDEGNPDDTGKPMVANGTVIKCTDSNVGDCANVKGDCVCSGASLAGLHLDVMRTACPNETIPRDTMAGSLPRCYFAGQPAPQSCDPAKAPHDDDCDGRNDAPAGGAMPPFALNGQNCWPMAKGQCAPTQGGKIVGCKIPQNGSSNCYQAFGVNIWWECDNTAICPVAEKCNGFDDDCNNMLPANEADGDGDGFTACGPCNGNTAISPNTNMPLQCGDCQDAPGTTGGVNNKLINTGAADRCNGVDDDCNGNTKDGTSDCPGGPPGMICCAGNGCKNSGADVNNCLGCNLQCTVANGVPGCTMAGCVIGSCNAPFKDCNNQYGDGCEVNSSTDVNNCANCGMKCSVANGVPRCTNSVCGVMSCNGAFRDCNNQYNDGCEIDTNSDANNCGNCAAGCSPNNIAATCGAGSCNGTCSGGFADCDNNKRTNGCEINTTNDTNHCGGCGMACSGNNIAAACGGSMCIGNCNGGFADCDGNKRTNGCEINIQTNASHCGGCNMACSGNNIAATCGGGNCNGVCTVGFADCDTNKRTNGCEINTTNDVSNCGGCGMGCSNQNINASCGAGACNGACTAGFGDCNNNKRSDGCETNTTNDVNHCGGCNMACSASNIAVSCGAGACNGTCNANFADCNNNKRTDGCEINTQTNTSHCGGCTMACSSNNIALSCSAGACNGACNANFADCDGDKRSNGCEVNTTNTIAHCGGCNMACSSNNITAACSGSACTGACIGSFRDCNTDKRSDGCEINISNDAANCGMCGMSCGANNNGHLCISSSCGCNMAADCDPTTAKSCGGMTANRCSCGTAAACTGGNLCSAGGGNCTNTTKCRLPLTKTCVVDDDCDSCNCNMGSKTCV